MPLIRPTIRVVEPAGPASEQALTRNLKRLAEAGFKVLYEPERRDSRFPMNASTDEVRARRLTEALTESSSDIVLAARGGYGSSAILRRLDWSAITLASQKLLVGFSDICAIHSALYTKLGRVGIHGPMPGSDLFGAHGGDVDRLLEILGTGPPWQSELPVSRRDRHQSGDTLVSGWLFGGNLAVLSGLIGTPWFPSDLKNAILFLEDVGEHAGRLARYFDQWVESGSLQEVHALVLGAFTNCGEGRAGQRETILSELERRVDCPVFESECFGHGTPNFPMAVGADVKIVSTNEGWRLTWQIQQ